MPHNDYYYYNNHHPPRSHSQYQPSDPYASVPGPGTTPFPPGYNQNSIVRRPDDISSNNTTSAAVNDYPSNRDYYGRHSADYDYYYGRGAGGRYSARPSAAVRRSRSVGPKGGSSGPSYYYPYYDDDDDGGGGAYLESRPRGHRSRRHHHHHSRHSPRDVSASPPPPRRRHRSHSHRDRKDDDDERIMQAVKAALSAGALEAFRLRNEEGDWYGEKGKRILTAAIGAGGTDGLLDRNGNPQKHEKRHIIESILAGLAANRAINGPRSHSRGGGRSRSRHHRHRSSGSDSHSRHGSGSGLKQAATAGVLAAAGKGVYDHVKNRSHSRSRDPHRRRGRSLSRSPSPTDGYVSGGSYENSPPPRRSRRSKKRSKSVSDYVGDGLSKLGLNDSGGGSRRSQRTSRHDYD